MREHPEETRLFGIVEAFFKLHGINESLAGRLVSAIMSSGLICSCRGNHGRR